MRVDQLIFESRISHYSDTFKKILRQSWNQTLQEWDTWEKTKPTHSDSENPLKKSFTRELGDER